MAKRCACHVCHIKYDNERNRKDELLQVHKKSPDVQQHHFHLYCLIKVLHQNKEALREACPACGERMIREVRHKLAKQAIPGNVLERGTWTMITYYMDHFGAIVPPESYNTCLLDAISSNRFEFFQYLISLGADIHYDNEKPLKVAFRVSHDNALPFLGVLIEKGADINSLSVNDIVHIRILDRYIFLHNNGYNLHADNELLLRTLYAGSDNRAVYNYVLEEANIHVNNDELLRRASSCSYYTDLVRTLISRGANIHALDDEALRNAAKNGCKETAILLLNNGADVHALDDEALRMAHRYSKIVTTLVQYGTNIHAREDEAIIQAAKENSFEYFQLLMSLGADIHARNDEALVLAAERGAFEIVELLLANGADPNAHNSAALFNADTASGWNRGRIIRLLIGKHGVDVHVMNDATLVNCARRYDKDLVAYLLDLGADIHAQNDLAIRSAFNACVEGVRGQKYEKIENDLHFEMVQYLIIRGANIHTEEEEMLRKAAENDLLPLVEFLVKNRADIHARNDESLRLAAAKGSFKLIQYLVEKGANVRANNDEALIQCTKRGMLDAVKFLVEHGADIHVNDNEPLIIAAIDHYQKLFDYFAAMM